LPGEDGIVSLQGRIDQVVRTQGRTVLREIKTVTRPLPAKRDELLADYPSYFVQAAAYAALRGAGEACELVFVEADSGLAQSVELTRQDEALLALQLDKIAEFLDLTLRARERLRGLRFRPAFAAPREGQESASRDLAEAVMAAQSAVLLQAPTGFGKTGVLIECALGALRDGAFDRVLYLTGKSTGQLHIVETLRGMTAAGPDLGSGASVAAWHVRNKSEHCVNSVFQCVREACAYLDGAEERWPTSGLSRFYLLDGQPRDLGSLRSAGLGARICPYEITRAALTFNDVWIGDYNYVFSPDSRGLFYDRPGFDPARTLVLIDEAHNLPSRAADAHSQAFAADEAQMVAGELRRLKVNAAFVAEWDAWAVFLASLEKAGLIGDEAQAEARRAPGAPRREDARDARRLRGAGAAGIGPPLEDPVLCRAAGHATSLPRLWWCPADGTLSITCLDAAKAVGATLGDYGGVVFATATPGPIESLCRGLRPPGRPPRKGADALAGPRLRCRRRPAGRHDLPAAPAPLRPRPGPWRPSTGPQAAPIAVFFPSYAYAEAVARGYGGGRSSRSGATCRPRMPGSTGPSTEGRALFLVLGSGFAEGIDLLGGRVEHAMVVGPALPEVNPCSGPGWPRSPSWGGTARSTGCTGSRDAEGEPGPGPPRALPRPGGPRPPALPALRRARLRAPASPRSTARGGDPRGRRPVGLARLGR
jgi:DNA excision repair protein ERCC-2